MDVNAADVRSFVQRLTSGHAGGLSRDVTAWHDAHRALQFAIRADATACDQHVVQIARRQRAIRDAVAFALFIAPRLHELLFECRVQFRIWLGRMNINRIAITADFVVEDGPRREIRHVQNIVAHDAAAFANAHQGSRLKQRNILESRNILFVERFEFRHHLAAGDQMLRQRLPGDQMLRHRLLIQSIDSEGMAHVAARRMFANAEHAGMMRIVHREDSAILKRAHQLLMDVHGILLPAFILSELKTAFTIGFVVYLPFLVIDIVVSSVLVSMGMMFLPPTMIALPFKLIMFVMVDGWYLVVKSLVESFVT